MNSVPTIHKAVDTFQDYCPFAKESREFSSHVLVLGYCRIIVNDAKSASCIPKRFYFTEHLSIDYLFEQPVK